MSLGQVTPIASSGALSPILIRKSNERKYDGCLQKLQAPMAPLTPTPGQPFRRHLSIADLSLKPSSMSARRPSILPVTRRQARMSLIGISRGRLLWSSLDRFARQMFGSLKGSYRDVAAEYGSLSGVQILQTRSRGTKDVTARNCYAGVAYIALRRHGPGPGCPATSSACARRCARSSSSPSRSGRASQVAGSCPGTAIHAS